MKYRVLVIDDEPSITRSLTRVLTDRGFLVSVAASGQAGLEKAETDRPHIVLLDLRLPDTSGIDLIPRIHRVENSTQIIVITAFADTQAAVQAMKAGATDFLRKPYDLDELTLAVETAARTFARDAHLRVYRRKDRSLYNPEQILYRSDAMSRVWELVRKVARSDAASVLITGESGTGKELVARGVHFEGARRRAPFMELNCSAFQETLLENELFGHERGAFTGASYLKRGLAELSDGGTLFLDEVGEMPAQTQAKLLRFLEDRSFRRVGGNVDIGIDVRIVAATNVDLARRIEEGRFRTDLFYRLQVVSIHLPPLRERGDDVNILAEHFLKRFAAELKRGFRTIDEDVRSLFRRYDWPGNVRELRNLIERIVIVEDGEVLTVEHLPPELRERAAKKAGDGADGPTGSSVKVAAPLRLPVTAGDELPTLHSVEEEYIRLVLARCEGNKSQAARILGLSRQGLLDRLRRGERAVEPTES
ncbi:MAG: sigma-54 dependent transcriptional regulator [bacterium]